MNAKTNRIPAKKRQKKGIRLVWLILVLTLVAGCTLLIPPEELPTSVVTTTTFGTGTTAITSSSTKSSATGQPSSGQTTTKPSSSGSSSTTGNTPKTETGTNATTSQPSTVTTSTPGTSTSASSSQGTSATTTATLTALSATPVSWSYIVPKPLNTGIRATIPTTTAKLIAPYPVIWQAKPTGAPTVYLTMDEGYEYGSNTSKILDIARTKSVRIAFFITGTYLRAHPDLVKRMVDEGHLVLNHTDTHPNLAVKLRDSGASAVLADIRKLESEFKTATGQEMPRLIRPPAGAYSQQLLALLGGEGYTTVFWSFTYRDWLTDDQPTFENTRSAIIGQLHDGSVLLLHAVSNTNTALLPELIDSIRTKGYRFGKLTDIG